MTLLTADDYQRLPTVEPDHRLAYGSLPEQFGELTLPNSSPPHAVIVLIHGGGYQARYDIRPLGTVAAALADAGLAVWSIEYRRAGNGGDFPNMFLDVGAAADHLRAIAGDFRLDLTSVVTIGHSAGGHLALWLAGRRRLPESSRLFSANPLPVAGVVGLAPIADIAHALRYKMSSPALQTVVGSQLPRAEDNVRDSSPNESLPLGIRQIHLVGTEDTQILANAQSYIDAATRAGDDVELVTLEGAGHFEVVAVGSPHWQTVLAAVKGMRKTAEASLQ